MLAEHLAERCLQQVRRGVVRHRREADAPRHDRADAIAAREARTAKEEDLVVVEAVRVDELGAHRRVVVALDPTVVGYLAAARRVERRLAQLREECAVAELLEGADLRQDVDLRVAHELRREPRIAGEVRRALGEPTLARAARDLPVPLHLQAVAVDVDLVSVLARELDRELDREAVGGCEPERRVAGDVAAGQLLELLHAAVERLAEPLLLGPDDALDLRGVLDHLRVPRADLLDHDPRQWVDGRKADTSGLHDRPPDQPAEHVAASLVGGRHAFGDEERHPAPVVAQDAMRLRRLLRLAVRDARLLCDPVHDQLEAVGVEDRLDALEEHRTALEAQAGVDVLLRQRRQRAVGGEVELHEDEIPQLQEPLAALAAGRAVGLAAAVLPGRGRS